MVLREVVLEQLEKPLAVLIAHPNECTLGTVVCLGQDAKKDPLRKRASVGRLPVQGFELQGEAAAAFDGDDDAECCQLVEAELLAGGVLARQSLTCFTLNGLTVSTPFDGRHRLGG